MFAGVSDSGEPTMTAHFPESILDCYRRNACHLRHPHGAAISKPGDPGRDRQRILDEPQRATCREGMLSTDTGLATGLSATRA